MAENSVSTSLENFVDPGAAEVYSTAFLQRLFQFLRLAELHQKENAIFKQVLAEILRTLSVCLQLPGTSSIDVTFRGEHIFINKIRLRPRPRQFFVYRFFLRFMRRKKIGAIVFKNLPTEHQMEQFLWLLSDVQYSEENLEPADTLMAECKKLGLQAFEVRRMSQLHASGSADDREGSGDEDLELLLAKTYRELLKFVQVSYDNLEKAAQLHTRLLGELLESLAGLSEEDLMQLLRLNTVKRYDRPQSYRAVNTAFLISAWATSLGLPKGVITELASTALLHILVEGTTPERNAELLARVKDFWPLSSLQFLALNEWEKSYGSDGVYDRDGTRCYLHFFSRMLKIASDYDRLTTVLPGQNTFLPDEALAHMMKTEKVYDPTFLKLFVNWIGIYPVGSLVLLNTGETAQVFAAASDPTKFQRPLVMILKDSRGEKIKRPGIFDLTTVNEKLGTYRKSIRKSLTLEESGLLPEDLKVTPVMF